MASQVKVAGGFLGLIYGSSAQTGNAIALDSNSNIYISGVNDGVGRNAMQFIKCDNDGLLQWQRQLSSGSIAISSNEVGAASSDNFIALGQSAANNQDWQMVRYNSGGTIQNQRNFFGDTTARFDECRGGFVKSGTVLMVGRSNSGGTNRSHLLNMDTTGSINFQRASTAGFGTTATMDSTNANYMIGFDPFTDPQIVITKYTSGGTADFQRRLGASSVETVAQRAKTDSSDNLYLCGYTTQAGNLDIYLAKYNSGGTLQWQKSLGGTGTQIGTGIAIDSNDDIYIIGYSNDSGNNDIIIAKYDSSGTIQWQRRLKTTASDFSGSVAVDNNSLYFVGTTEISGNRDIVYGKLPKNGGGAGTYTLNSYSFDYEAATLTDATRTLTAATPSFTLSTGVLNSGNSGFTDGTTSLSEAQVQLT